MGRLFDFLNEEKPSEKTEKEIFNLVLGKHNHTLADVQKNNPKELKMGIKVEYEHVPNGTPRALAKEIATRIALDHIAECKTYYTRLKRMEKECSINK